MKIINTLLTLSLFYFFSCKEKNIESSPLIQECKEKTFENYDGTNLIYRGLYDYDKNNNIVKSTGIYIDNNDKYTEIALYENFYDSKNNLIKAIRRIDGRIDGIIKYEYHENKKLKKSTWTDESETYIHIQEYNEMGLQTRYYDNGQESEYTTTYDSKGNILIENIIQDNKFFGKTINEYKDFLIVKKTQTFSDNSIQITTYSYDSNKKLVQELTGALKELYFYNNDQLLSEKKTYYGINFILHEKYEYNNQKQRVKNITSDYKVTTFYTGNEYTYHSNGKQKERSNYFLKSGSKTQTYKSYYDYYDEKGNFIESISYNQDGTQSGRYFLTYICD